MAKELRALFDELKRDLRADFKELRESLDQDVHKELREMNTFITFATNTMKKLRPKTRYLKHQTRNLKNCALNLHDRLKTTKREFFKLSSTRVVRI
ncbi:hypothetical protein HPB48_015831 [Haemaphysalis longicornis]|uniref:Uncharacterized protein n=1 Tax=Haemaphysalis longicornis TaxID=44386 RepID=A0A9J6FA20_HAELO|nr:hypothetical protein HPB48_015831 [Haemaphysalis longicornis]